MQKHAEKISENKSQAVSNSLAGQSSVLLKDNRPESVVQKKMLDALADRTSQLTLQKKANKTGLPDTLKSGIENISGHSMDDVKVHYNSSKPAQLNAHAYAQGTEIHIASGQEKHLPHEAWHVVQQKQGRVKPTMQLKEKVNVNDDEGLEKEADVMGAKGLQAGNKNVLQKKLQRKIISNVQQPVQAVLNLANFNAVAVAPWGTTNKSVRKNVIAGLITRYNVLLNSNTQSQADLDNLLKTLDDLEHKIYRWFDLTKANPLNVNHNAMFTLMDEVQAEHKSTVNMVVANGRRIWVKDRGGHSKKDVQDLWDEIVNGNGHFTIRQTVMDHLGVAHNIPAPFMNDMRTELFSSFARLMSRPQGIKLLMLYKQGNAHDKDIEFVLSPLYNLIAGGALGPSKATAVHGSPALISHATGIGRNTGSGSQINFVPAMRDSSVMDRDVNNNPILSPTFVGFGHEVTHSAHYQHGSYFPNAHMAGIPAVYGGDMEELLTIAPSDELTAHNASAVTGNLYSPTTRANVPVNTTFSNIRKKNKDIPTEGDIRREHGLSIRHGHTNTTSNPMLHPGGIATIPDTVNWAAPLHHALAPPPPAAPAAPAVPVAQPGLCFLTTACTQARGLPDDCEELTLLRQFRDTYLLNRPDGKELIKLYYRVAPGIVNGIHRRPDAPEILEEIYTVIKKCVVLIKSDQQEKTYRLYMKMVKKLHAQYGAVDALK